MYGFYKSSSEAKAQLNAGMARYGQSLGTSFLTSSLFGGGARSASAGAAAAL